MIASLLMMRVAKQPVRVRTGHVLQEMRDGLVYVNGVPLVRALLLSLAAISVLGGAYTACCPRSRKVRCTEGRTRSAS